MNLKRPLPGLFPIPLSPTLGAHSLSRSEFKCEDAHRCTLKLCVNPAEEA